MNNLTWKYVKPLTDPEQARSFLKEHQVVLPSALLTCMLNNNGGRPSQKEFSTTQGNGYVFKNLLSLNSTDKESVYRFYPDLFFGTQLFPFALDSAGNFLCYDLQQQRYVLWKHETDTTEPILL